MSWATLTFNDNYQIFTEFPYQIRNINSKRIIKESIDSKGYVYVCINRKQTRKHRLVALQFIPNPDNLPQVDHIDRDKTNYHVNNLRWVDNATNQQNAGSTRGVQHEFFNKIPNDDNSPVIEVNEYNNYTFENLYYSNNYFYFYNGINYKRANIHNEGRGCYIYAYDTTHHQRKISYLKFKRLHDLS